MKNIGFILGYLILVFSCTNDANELVSESNSSELNLKTKYIQTTNDPENLGIIPTLITDLKSQKIELEDRDIHPMDSFYNWIDDIQFVIQGNGMNAYYFKRTEAKPENYYPDFTISVFEFNSEEEAQACFDKIEAPAKRGMQLRGTLGQKSPQTIVQKGNEVIYLSTRAEMFRGYIDDCVKRIEGY